MVFSIMGKVLSVPINARNENANTDAVAYTMVTELGIPDGCPMILLTALAETANGNAASGRRIAHAVIMNGMNVRILIMNNPPKRFVP